MPSELHPVPPAEPDRYREMADEVRGLISSLQYPEAIESLWLLAAGYDSLAAYLEAGRGHSPNADAPPPSERGSAEG